jgi:Domain of unknown function (DUF1905)/Bacteriocin-protection, YdeI or OmpD-Associated
MIEPITFSAIVAESTNKLWTCHIEIPSAIAAIFLAEGSQRVVCTINKTHTYQCALLSFGEGRRVVTVNKATAKKLNLQYGNTAEVTLQKDESQYGLPMPEEFEEILKSDAMGNRFFEALTDGKKRTLLYMAAKPKSSDTRINIGLIIMEHLKAENGKIDFKKLNLAFKNDKNF